MDYTIMGESFSYTLGAPTTGTKLATNAQSVGDETASMVIVSWNKTLVFYIVERFGLTVSAV
jgi:hypothetical protein